MYYGPYVLHYENGDEIFVDTIIEAVNKWLDEPWIEAVLDYNRNPIPEDVLKVIAE